MKAALRFGLFALATLATGCVAVHFTPLQPYNAVPRPLGSVEFFREGMPNRPFREVGILRVNSSIGFDAALQHLMEAGADYGCDAVAGMNAGQYQTVAVGYRWASVQSHDEITASCLIYTGPPGAQPPMAQPPQYPPPQPPPMPPPAVRGDE